MSFSELGLVPWLSSPLPAMGYVTPTPVQAAAIPVVLRGADLVARAQTGTGKTAAFGLPMIHRLHPNGRRTGHGRPRALVLVPTRELAAQVHASLVKYGAPVRVRVTQIIGGVSMGPQIRALREGADIVVATPGRLVDHLQRRTVDLTGIEILVLDEADRMLDMGFLPPLRRVLQAMPAAKQTLLFSATLSPEIVRLSAEFTRSAEHVDVTPVDPVAATITHHVHPVHADSKRALLLRLLTQPSAGQALVFCKTKRGADRVGEHLTAAGVRSAVIHGNKAQNARTRSLADFRNGRVSVLVATDIAARGLDIAQLPLVVNYDLPLVPEDYVHRVGRTGRAGIVGRAVSLVTTADVPLLRAIQRLLPEPVEHVSVAGFETTISMAAEERPRRAPAPGRRPRRAPHARHMRSAAAAGRGARL